MRDVGGVRGVGREDRTGAISGVGWEWDDQENPQNAMVILGGTSRLV